MAIAPDAEPPVAPPDIATDQGPATPAPTPPAGDGAGLLSRSPAFRALLAGRAVSSFGDGVGNLALVVHVRPRREQAPPSASCFWSPPCPAC